MNENKEQTSQRRFNEAKADYSVLQSNFGWDGWKHTDVEYACYCLG